MNDSDGATMTRDVVDALMGVALTRDLIFAADDEQLEQVEVPEWGGALWVRGLTGEERDAFEASMVQTKGRKQRIKIDNIRAGLVARAACTARGERLFSDGDIGALGRKSAVALNRVYEVAARLSGITEEDVDELAEAFLDDPSGSSTTS